MGEDGCTPQTGKCRGGPVSERSGILGAVRKIRERRFSRLGIGIRRDHHHG